MQYTRAGIILFTENYEDCVSFYGEILKLEVMHEIDRPGERLTTFDLGGMYLMVETGGIAHSEVTSMDRSPIKFRFNVANVNDTSTALRNKGVDVRVFDHSWGTTAEFNDPDGNCCALRSDDGFGE